jgi:hypothetical protein
MGRLQATLPILAPWWPPLLLVILPILLFHQGLGTNTPPFGGDIVVLDYPLLTLIKHQLDQGLFPLWNNYAGGGYPLVPFSGLIAYPLIWPLHFLSVNDEITLLVIAHFALAGLGAYALAGVTGASRMGRTVGALAFLLSGFLISHLFAGHLFELGVIAWMPWVFLAAHRLLDRPSARAALVLGIVAALQLLANGISFLVFTVYPVGILLLAGLIGVRRRELRAAQRLIGYYALAALAALSLAAVIVLPFVQVVGWTIRSNGLDYKGASQISLPPAALLMAFSPDAVGDEPNNTYWLSQFAAGYWHEFAFYVGLVPLVATVAAAIYRARQPHVRFYTALLVVSVIFAFGRYTPIYGWAFHLPLLNLVRVPARWLLPATLCVSVLAAPGFDWLSAQREGALVLWRCLRWPLLAAGALILVILVTVQAIYAQANHTTDLQPALFTTVIPAGDRLLIFGGYTVLVLACAAERLIRPQAARFLLLGCTMLDLWCAASGFVRFLDPTPFYSATTLSNLLQSDPDTYRVLTIDRSMPNRQGMVSDNLYDAEDYAPITLRPYFSVTQPLSKLVEISNADGRDLIRCFDARSADLVGITDITIATPSISPYLCNVPGVQSGNLKLVSAVATQSWLLPEGTNWNPSPHFTVTYLYHNPDALPRTFLLPVSAAHVVPGPDIQLQAVLEPHFDGTKQLLLDPKTSEPPLGLGFLQTAWADWLRPTAAPIPGNLQPGQARVTSDTSNSVQVAFNAAAPSYLVLNDAYYPGWQAWLDGKPVSIRRADYLMRAIQVPAGTHRLVFTYAPVSYLAGLVISVLSALIIAAALLWSWKPWTIRGRGRARALPGRTTQPLMSDQDGLVTLSE